MMTVEGRTAPVIPFGEAARVWLKIGCLGFGGPAGQIALLHRVLVEEKRWLAERQFLQALNYCMLLPGPEAQQLAVYAGWLLHGTRGGVLAGTLFVLPGALVILLLSMAYARFGATAGLQAIFFGIKAAVLALVLQALIRIGRRVLKSRVAYAIAALAFLSIYALHIPFPLIVLGAALLGALLQMSGQPAFAAAMTPGERDAQAPARPFRFRSTAATIAIWGTLWLLPPLLLMGTLGPGHVFTTLSVFFSKLAAVTFGGAYAALAYVTQDAVVQYGWLGTREMLDGLGLAETTPGPLILVLEYVGFLAAYREAGGMAPLLAGTLGAGLSLWALFMPSFLWIFAGAPYIERLSRSPTLHQALSAVTAAIVGVILNLSLWFALHVLFGALRSAERGGLRVALPELATLDLKACALALLAGALLFVARLGPLATIALCAGLGALWICFGWSCSRFS